MAHPADQILSWFPSSRASSKSSGQHLFEVVEQLRITEELGHLDEEGAYKLPVLLRMLLHIPGVLVDALAVGGGHPATQAPQDRGPLVAPEVHAAVAVQFLEKTLQGTSFVLRALLRHRYARDQILQYRPDLSREETMSTVLGASERGISPNSAVSGSCMMTVPPAWLTVRALGAVRACAAQDDGDEVLPEDSAAVSISRFMEGMGGPEDGSEERSISESVMFTCLLAGTTKTTPAEAARAR